MVMQKILDNPSKNMILMWWCDKNFPSLNDIAGNNTGERKRCKVGRLLCKRKKSSYHFTDS